MKSVRVFILLIFSVVALSSYHSRAQFIDFGPARDFLEFDAHVHVGGSGVFQNYIKKFPQIRELNTMAGTSYGAGARAVFGLRDFLGLGTELNLNLDGYSMDFAISNEDGTNISNVFLRNRYLYAHIPLFISFRFNVSGSIRLHFDLGLYYEYGLFGKQSQSIYSNELNELGQLVPLNVFQKSNYFNSTETFINSFYHSDLGLHLALGLRLGRHITVGAKFGIGMKNISFTDGIKNPSVRNYNIWGVAGYQF